MNDHRSKFSNLSSWKEKPEKTSGLPKTVLYDSTLEPIETCTARATKHAKDIESFRALILIRNFMFHKINILSTKVLSHFYVSCLFWESALL